MYICLLIFLFSYEDEIMQGNFADQTLFTPAKPSAVKSLQPAATKTNDTLQDLELDHSDLNLTDDLNQTDDLLASPERDEIDSVEKVESKTEEEVDLETPSKEEVSFENIPATERSESPDPIIAQQEIIPDSVPEVQEVIPSESPKPSEPVQPEPKVQDRNDSPVESTPEPDEEIIEENVITDTDSVKNEITESDIRKVAEDLIDKTLDNVEQKLKVTTSITLLINQCSILRPMPWQPKKVPAMLHLNHPKLKVSLSHIEIEFKL